MEESDMNKIKHRQLLQMAIEFGKKADLSKYAMMDEFKTLLEISYSDENDENLEIPLSKRRKIESVLKSIKPPQQNIPVLSKPSMIQEKYTYSQSRQPSYAENPQIDNFIENPGLHQIGETKFESFRKNSNLLINKFIENPGLQHIGQTIFLYLDRRSFLNCISVCKLWKDFLESPRVSIKHAQQILQEKHRYMWDFWINETKDKDNYKSTVEELLRKMLKNPILQNPMHMAMTSQYDKSHIYNLFENIYPMKMLKCPLCDKEWNDLKIKLYDDGKRLGGLNFPSPNIGFIQGTDDDTLAIGKEHIFDHLKTDSDYIQWSMSKLECFTKKNVMLRKQNPNVVGWVYNCSMCKCVLLEGITEDIAKEKALKHLSLCPLKTFEPTKKAIIDLRKSTDSHNILRTYIQKNGRFNTTFIHSLYFDDDYKETRLICRDENISFPVYLPHRVSRCE